ncbi:MAG: RsmE family RNA methyltransferase [Deltaproteobacteria bacterium]|nr:RsmE family RNA methyltransferase [Deltaproteobacteria bacterium]
MTRVLLDALLSCPGEAVVTGDELHYLRRVRRLEPGDPVEVRDLRGRLFSARVVLLGKERAVLALEAEAPAAREAAQVNVIIAVPKRHLLDDVVRQLSEIGVARLAPVVSERSVARPGKERAPRWRRIAAESVRQCGRARPMAVDDVRPFADVLRELAGKGTRLVLHERETSTGLSAALGKGPVSPPLTLAVGPEGGFSPDEILLSADLGFAPMGLGPSVLRVETAAVVAATLAVAALGGFEP